MRNDVFASGLEHKLGIHASPTCTMQYGDKGGATGFLVGKENEGLKNMFIMMNNARLAVGLQGVALAERAFQHALQYAKDRTQGRLIDDKSGTIVPISEHADVKRMLMSMQSRIIAGRALVYEAGIALDKAREGDAAAKAKVNLLTPVVKAWCTDMANDAAALGVQVHGGMGFVEETGAAQYVRDARILSIYEGTNGVQAQDLFVQKLLKDKGAAMDSWLKEAWQDVVGMSEGDVKQELQAAITNLRAATGHMLEMDLAAGAAVSVPFQQMFGTVAGGVMIARASNHDESPDHIKKLARFYAVQILPEHQSLLEIVKKGADSVLDYKFD